MKSRGRDVSKRTDEADRKAHPSSVAGFWKWFAQNQHHMAELDWISDDDVAWKHLGMEHELNWELARIHPGLRGIWKVRGDLNVLVIGGSNLQMTGVILQIVRTAPEIPGWDVYPFQLPRELATPFDDHSDLLPISDVWCAIRIAPSGLTLMVYCAQRTALSQPSALVMLDVLYDRAWLRRVFSRIEFSPLPPDSIAESVFPFDAIPAALDMLKLRLHSWEVESDYETWLSGSLPALPGRPAGY